MKLIQISDFKIGNTIQGFYFCKDKNLRYAKNGELFIDLTFSDSTGIISGKLWNLVENFNERFDKGDPVAVKGEVTKFNDSIQLKVLNINKATANQYSCYGFSNELLIKQVSEPIEILWKRMLKITKTLSIPYKKLIQLIIKNYEMKIKIIPASLDLHYPIKGGFLKHIVTMLEMAVDILPNYPDLNRDLVLSGLILHDIGKIESFNDDIMIDYSNAGKIVGDLGLGLDILRKTVNLIDGFPKQVLFKLEHVILMSQEVKDLSAFNKLKFPEATLIKSLCVLDTHMYMALSSFE